MKRLKRFLESAVTQAGRLLEVALTGQTDYRIRTSAYENFDTVSDLFKARLLEDGVRSWLQQTYGIEVQNPLILDLYDLETPPSPSEACPGRVVGYYRPQELKGHQAHSVFVVRNLPRSRFKAIYAHEVVHAYQRETGLLHGDRALKEGLARWIEYKVYLREGVAAEANKVRRLIHWTGGRAVHNVFDIEKTVGEANVLAYLREHGGRSRP